ncbi:acyl-CoA dehydrogenase family protein [Desertimonas flava]|uniref:acyl-CoA dehydrogenase family protein n=1 Tax=Desertimonas flava TaxID=2064846 RepID=UPI000E341D87|nr:acyl-CoA dehydrogenase family protein [Desertimonas flava]
MVTTHEVLNQAVPLEGHDAASTDVALIDGVARYGGAWGLEELAELGRRAGDHEWIRAGELANEHHPELHRYDRFGHRIDQVEYHPAYHRLIGEAVRGGLHAAPWADGRPGAHVVRAARFAVWTQVEAGHGCPVSMTYSIVPALRADADLAAEWEPRLTSRVYDGDDRPASEKGGALAGMAMTEKQGGSDVRANTTRAVPAGDGYALTGHKWFCSAPMSDLFLMLAQTDAGLTCFAVPRWLPDGTRNAIRVERLKDKLGNRSNASSEIELEGAWGRRLGGDGAGVSTIIRMVNHTRLDCVIGVTGQMRAGLIQAIHHTRHRSAFGRRLADQPLMHQVLADLAIESEAATVTMLRLAAAYDAGDETMSRLATAVAKYWCCKRTPMFAAEALECFGGNGYVEEGPMARLFRESPLNGIWEGSGNVIALDVMRAVAREPDSLAAVLAEIELAAGADTRFDRFVADLHAELAGLPALAGDEAQRGARRLAERLALALQGSLLLRHSTAEVADAFCGSRLARTGGAMFGTLPDGVDAAAIVERAFPA